MDLQSLEITDLSGLIELLLPSVDGDMGIRLVSLIGAPLFRAHYTIGTHEYSGVGRSPIEAFFCAYHSCDQLKKCSRCDEVRPLLMFPRRVGGKDGRMSHCLVCDRERKKKWYPRANRPHLRAG